MLRTNHPSPFGTGPCSVFSSFDSGTIASALRNVSSRYIPFTQGGSRLRWEDIGVEELLNGHGRECRLVHEEVSVAGARVDEVRVVGGVGDDIAPPHPRAACMLEHRQEQQVLEPHHG